MRRFSDQGMRRFRDTRRAELSNVYTELPQAVDRGCPPRVEVIAARPAATARLS